MYLSIDMHIFTFMMIETMLGRVRARRGQRGPRPSAGARCGWAQGARPRSARTTGCVGGSGCSPARLGGCSLTRVPVCGADGLPVPLCGRGGGSLPACLCGGCGGGSPARLHGRGDGLPSSGCGGDAPTRPRDERNKTIFSKEPS
jgi:hypothetical protein